MKTLILVSALLILFRTNAITEPRPVRPHPTRYTIQEVLNLTFIDETGTRAFATQFTPQNVLNLTFDESRRAMAATIVSPLIVSTITAHRITATTFHGDGSGLVNVADSEVRVSTGIINNDLQSSKVDIGVSTAALRTDINNVNIDLQSSKTAIGVSTATLRTNLNSVNADLQSSKTSIGISTAGLRTDLGLETWNRSFEDNLIRTDLSAVATAIGVSTSALRTDLDAVALSTGTLVRKDGDTMTGDLSVPRVFTSTITFADGTVMVSTAGLGGGGAGVGDNLGNHTATQNLDMSNFGVVNVSSITATGSISAISFHGDGSHLTGIVGGGGGDNLGNHTANQNLNMSNFAIINTSSMTSVGDIVVSDRTKGVILSPFNTNSGWRYRILVEETSPGVASLVLQPIAP